jgi:NitT/TauT family transport system substrate-binding protein
MRTHRVSQSAGPTRRSALAAGLGLALGGSFISVGRAAGRDVINAQLSWRLSNNQLGEISAMALGYYEAENIELKLQPGGPSNDGVAVVASGRSNVGQLSSSSSLLLAVSQGIPLKCFASVLQRHPFTFFSLPRAPVRTPRDMIGKRIGIQATSRPLLRGLLLKNGLKESDVTVVVIGAELTPLLTGQVDVATGWMSNGMAVGPDRIEMPLWDFGVKLYALPYYATTQTLRDHRDLLARFVRASAKGWAYAYQNLDAAVANLLKVQPELDPVNARATAEQLVKFAYDENTRSHGWGAMSAQVWQEQIDLFKELEQFTARVPAVDEVYTGEILEMTRDARPRLG